MIKIFFGDDRGAAQNKIKKELGDDYEIFEGADLTLDDLPSLFLGTSLFAEKRKILIRDFSENKDVFEKVANYVETPHEVIIFEMKFDKRTVAYKELAAKNVKMEEFVMPVKNHDFWFSDNIYNTAKKDGAAAVRMVKEIEEEQEPIPFVGAMAKCAMRDYELRQGKKEKRVLAELSKLDMQMKSTSLQPWQLVCGFLLRLSSWWRGQL